MSEGPMKITRKDAFQVCPEWVLLADISAQAVRLYLVLSKASDNETKTHHWGRKKIAEAMRLKSPRSVDRYLGELAAIGAVKIQAQFKDGRQTTNEYQIVTVDPSQYSARGVADLNTPGVADLNTPGVAENCSQSYNLYDLRTSTNLPSAAVAATTSRPEVDKLCELLADRIEANGSKRPTITKRWEDSCRLMLDRDGRTPEQVAYLIDWSQSDSFWKSNILSMPKLRDKFDQLRLQATSRNGPSKSDQRAENILRMVQDMEGGGNGHEGYRGGAGIH